MKIHIIKLSKLEPSAKGWHGMAHGLESRSNKVDEEEFSHREMMIKLERCEEP